MSRCIDIVLSPLSGSSPPGLLRAIADEVNEIAATISSVPSDDGMAERSCVPTVPESTWSSRGYSQGTHEARHGMRNARIRWALCGQRTQASQNCERIASRAMDDFCRPGSLCPGLSTDIEEVVRCIARLKDLGVQVEVDVLRRSLPDLTEDRMP